MLDIARFEEDGFAIIPGVLGAAETRKIAAQLDAKVPSLSNLNRGGTRDVLDRLPTLRALADHPAILEAVKSILGQNPFVVRATLFDKTPDSNWKVPWHQDVTIAVQERCDADGYGPWSVKTGVTHVQPPSQVLERMLSLRIHIDPCHRTNGALKVMPGSHKLGRLDQNTVGSHINEQSSRYCEANPGDALLMRPLLLHASSAAVDTMHRRVLHFDYAVGELAGGLQWKMRA